LYQDTNRLKEAEPLMLRALDIDEASLGSEHPEVARDLNNLAQLYQATNRLKEAEPLMHRALAIDEAAFGPDHPDVARDLNNLARLYQDTNRLKQAEPLMQRHLLIFLQFTRRTGHRHPHLQAAIENYTALLMEMGHSKDQVTARLKRLAPELFESADKQAEEE
jgi:tetratricopeptide (TPR) repeat protein